MAAGLTLAACSDDDNGSTPTPAPEVANLKLQNDVDFFTESFVSTDSLGRFHERVDGRPLPSLSADTTLLFLGVESVEQARSKFLSWLPTKAQTVEQDDKIIFYPTDTLGRSQGTITFTPYTSDGMNLARVVISDDCPIRRDWISAVRFIDKTAWPDNAGSKYEVGEVVNDVRIGYALIEGEGRHHVMKGNWNVASRALCVKPYEAGSPGMLLVRMDECIVNSKNYKLIYEKNDFDDKNLHRIAPKLSRMKQLRSLYYPEGVSQVEASAAHERMEKLVEDGLDINLEKGTIRDGGSWRQVTHSNRPALIWTDGYEWHLFSRNGVQGFNFDDGEDEWFYLHDKWYGMFVYIATFDEYGKISTYIQLNFRK